MQYKNSTAGFVKLRKQTLKRAIIISLIAMTAALIITHQTEKNEDLIAQLFSIAVIIGIIIFAILKAIKTQEDIYNSFVLTLTDTNISSFQKNLGVATIPFENITQISENKHGLTIKGNNKSVTMIISPSIENYDEIKNHLQCIHSIIPQVSQNIFDKNPILSSAFLLCIMIAVFTSNNKITVGICGTVLLVVMIFCLYKIQTSNLIGRDVKIKSWWLLVVIASVIAIIYYKVFLS